jgi:hypothetical protein
MASTKPDLRTGIESLLRDRGCPIRKTFQLGKKLETFAASLTALSYCPLTR